MTKAAKKWLAEYKKLFNEVSAYNKGQNVAENAVASEGVKKIERIGKVVESAEGDDESRAAKKVDKQLPKRYNKRKVLPTDEYATNAMIWAHSDKTSVGERKLFYRKGKWVLLEKSNDGFVELKSYNDNQSNKVKEEILKYNEAIREDLYTCIMRHEAFRGYDMWDNGDDGRKQTGDGRYSTVHQEKSESDGSGDYQSGESSGRTVKDDGSRSALKKEGKTVLKDARSGADERIELVTTIMKDKDRG